MSRPEFIEVRHRAHPNPRPIKDSPPLFAPVPVRSLVGDALAALMLGAAILMMMAAGAAITGV